MNLNLIDDDSVFNSTVCLAVFMCLLRPFTSFTIGKKESGFRVIGIGHLVESAQRTGSCHRGGT